MLVRNEWLLLGLGVVLATGGVQANPPRGTYVAALAVPLPAPRQQIIHGALWKCAGERCSAAAGHSRPLLVCQRVAKAFGEVARFATPAGELSREDIARCNSAS